MSSLKYYNAGVILNKTPKESYKDDYCNIYKSLVDNAPNVFYDVEVEKTYGERDFVATRARVDSVITPSTGEKWGDDFKWFIFDPDDEKTYVGRLIRWKKNYWIVINCNTYESLGNGCVARRCNNELRWIDDDGNLIKEPVSINYDIMEQGDYAGKDLTTIAGFEKFFCQKNKRTINIKANMRFLFGVKENPICYRVYANGIRNFLNNIGDDNYSPSVLELWMGANYPNQDTDDFDNLIADAYKNSFSLVINQDTISESLGYETQLQAFVKKNCKDVSVPIVWSSSDSDVCSIDESGNLKCLSVGNAVIKAEMLNNNSVYDTIEVIVSEVPEDDYDVRINAVDYGYSNCIFQGDEVVYECHLYKNNKIQNNEFTFELITNSSDKNYKFEILSPNSFRIKNIRKSNNLDIVCRTDNEITYEFNVELKGAF